jgi:hypothetical protein
VFILAANPRRVGTHLLLILDGQGTHTRPGSQPGVNPASTSNPGAVVNLTGAIGYKRHMLGFHLKKSLSSPLTDKSFLLPLQLPEQEQLQKVKADSSELQADK